MCVVPSFCIFLPLVFMTSQIKMLAGDIRSESQIWSKTSKIWTKPSMTKNMQIFIQSPEYLKFMKATYWVYNVIQGAEAMAVMISTLI
jgi:hypothetical protein